jgi:DNA-binding PadR family transcriptional regulator
MTKVDMMVLGLLSEQPMHGYQLKQVLEDNHADLWSEVSTGHLYYTLKKLKKKGLVTEKTTQRGNRPPRHVYTLTDSGTQMLKDGLDELDVHSQRLFFSLDIVIGFAKAISLPQGKLAELIEKRTKSVNEELEEIKTAWGEKIDNNELTYGEYLIYEHRISLLKAELKWLRWAVKAAENTDYKDLMKTKFEADGPYALPK